ncbi:MAG TPA: 50S ribosomal protein L3 [Patescibacteria group bacterium]|jgi:large subunit ribosomal protein L3
MKITKTLIGEKVGMTRVFDTAGNALGATVLKVWPSTVVRLRTKDKDGYEAMQVGAGVAKEKRVGKAVLGQSKGTAYRVLTEFPKTKDDIEVGAVLGADQLQAGELVHVTSVSKGKGFQGTIKRHNFSRGPKTHGSRNYRAPGSIGGTGASRVFAGQKMPGRMGADRVTTRNVLVLSVDEAEGLVILRGSVPGPNGVVVTVRGEGMETKEPVAASDAHADEAPTEDPHAVPQEQSKKKGDGGDDGKPEGKDDAPAKASDDKPKADDKKDDKKADDKSAGKKEDKS